MKRYFKIYLLFIKNSFIQAFAHRFDVVMSALANIIWTLGQVVSLSFITSRIKEFKGWNFGELVLLLGFGQILIYTMFFFYDANLNEFRNKIINGEMDRYLTRPLNIKFLISFERVSIPQIIPMITTVIPLIVFGLSKVNKVGAHIYIEAFVISFISILIFYFLSLGLAGLNLIVEDATSLKEFLINGSLDLNRVPLDIFPKIVQGIMTFIVPVAFATFYPVFIIRQKVNFIPVLLGGVFVLIIMNVVSKVIWSKGLKRYSGVG